MGILVVPSFAAKLQVVTTIPDLADFARQVGGERVEVYSIATGEEDPHNIEMRPSMITKLAKADAYIQMGLDLEHSYAPAMLAECRNQKIQIGQSGFIDTSKGISAREIPKSLDRSEGDVHPSGNPHYNLDPVCGKQMVSKVAEGLSKIRAEDAAYFQANAEKYNRQLDEMISKWKSKLSGKNIKFVSYHPHWTYFAERFDVHPVGTIQIKPGIEPGPRHLEELIKQMKKESVKLILKESFYSDRLPQEIAEKTGATVLTVPIMVGGTPEAKDYISMIDQVVNVFTSSH